MRVDVLLESQGQSHHAGELQQDDRKGKQAISFQFTEDWLTNASIFQFDPKLPKSRGYHYPDQGKHLLDSISYNAPYTAH